MPAIRLDPELITLSTLFLDLGFDVMDSCTGHGEDGTKRRLYFSFEPPVSDCKRIEFWEFITSKMMSRGMKIEKSRNNEFKLFFDYLSTSSRDAAIRRMERVAKRSVEKQR